jgi:hypothetical protein
MRNLLLAIVIALAMVLTAVLTAGATVLALKRTSWLDALDRTVAPAPLPAPVEPADDGAGRSAEARRARVEEPPGPDDDPVDVRERRAAPPPVAIHLVVAEDGTAPSSAPVESTDEPASSIAGGEGAADAGAAGTAAPPTPGSIPPVPALGSIDYLKLSDDLKHVSQTLERFNAKLLRLIAQHGPDPTAPVGPTSPPKGATP